MEVTGGAVGIVENVIEDKNNPGDESLILVGGFQKVGDVILSHELPHFPLVSFGVGKEALTLSRFFPQADVGFECLIRIINRDDNAFFLGETKVITSFWFQVS